MAGGDDYELCFTISAQNYHRLLQQQLDINITMIGQITKQKGLTFELDGAHYPLQFHGYQHLA